MRRISLVYVGTLAVLISSSLVGCGALRDAFSSRADVVARANNQTLTVDRVAGWAGANRDLPLDQQTLGRVAHAWVDYTLFAEAVAGGKNLLDSSTALASMWPLISQIKWQRLHERLTARDNLTARQVDSAYQVGDLRMFQHILFEVRPPQAEPTGQHPKVAPNVDAQKRQQAEQLLAQARAAGAGFAKLASKYSDDPGSKSQGGFLGISTRGQFVPQFEEAAWKLPPGGVSPVVKTQFGYHIIRRPPLAEVRDSFRVELEQRITRQFDSVYVDSLEIKRKIKPVDRAPDYVRTALSDLDAARGSNEVLVKYRGGSLRVHDLIRWLAALNPQLIQTLPTANNDQIDQFLKILAQRQLLLEQADSAGIKLTADDWQRIREEHDSTIATLTAILNLTPEVLRDSAGKTSAERSQFAAARATDYLDRVLHKRARYFPVPMFLADRLRDQGSWDVDETGIRRASERGEELRGADSTQSTAPHMTPAPGPPPIDTARRQSGGKKGR